MIIARADGGEGLQLAVHHVWRAHPLYVDDAVVDRVHRDFVIGGMTGVMLAVPPAEFVLHKLAVPGRAFP